VRKTVLNWKDFGDLKFSFCPLCFKIMLLLWIIRSKWYEMKLKRMI
jgi:hypothetical protein